ncbi:hypothetical protein V8B97DRAFT_2024807 [Scleroderma yunnanense]
MLQFWPRSQSPLLLFVAALAIQVAEAPVTASKVLTPDNFQETIVEGVWFKQADPGVHLAQVNCALNGDLCSEKGTFNANREFDLLVDYFVKHAEPTETPAQDIIVEEEKLLVEPTPDPTPTPIPELALPQMTHAEPNTAGEVVSLTKQTFDRFLSEGPAFTNSLYGHCKKLAPTWSQLARHVQHKMNIAEVNCDDSNRLCSSQGVAGYPTLFYYTHGAKTEYSGSRKYDQLVAFTEQASSPNTMQVIDASELEQVVRGKPVNNVAKGYQLLFGSPPVYLSSQDLFKKYGVRADNDVREPTSTFYSSSDVFQQVMEVPNKFLEVLVSTPNGAQGAVAEKLNEIGKRWCPKVNQMDKSGRRVVFTWMDADQWEVVVADHGRLLYCEADGSGQRIKMNFLRAIFKGTAKAKHSENIFERVVKHVKSGILALEHAIVSHPYLAGSIILVIFVATFAALRRLLREDAKELTLDKRFVKDGPRSRLTNMGPLYRRPHVWLPLPA